LDPVTTAIWLVSFDPTTTTKITINLDDRRIEFEIDSEQEHNLGLPVS
jgi:hypothetical protein